MNYLSINLKIKNKYVNFINSDNTISKSSVGTPTKKSGKKGVQSKNVINLTGRLIDADDWVNVPEFIPRTIQCEKRSNKRLCPYAERDGICKYPPGECAFIHGNICELCAKPALHPFDEDLRKKHTQVNIHNNNFFFCKFKYMFFD